LSAIIASKAGVSDLTPICVSTSVTGVVVAAAELEKYCVKYSCNTLSNSTAFASVSGLILDSFSNTGCFQIGICREKQEG